MDLYHDLFDSKAPAHLKAQSLRALGAAYRGAGDDVEAERVLARHVAAIPEGGHIAGM